MRVRLSYRRAGDLIAACTGRALDQLRQATGDWEPPGRPLAADTARLQAAGAQILALATNTMHQVYDQIAAAVSIAFPHIAKPTAAAVKAAGLTRVGLLGTRFTMERGFYRDRLEAAHGLSALVPDEPDRDVVHRVIYDELVQGVIRDESRKRYLEIISRLADRARKGSLPGAPRSSYRSPAMTPDCPGSLPLGCTPRPPQNWPSPTAKASHRPPLNRRKVVITVRAARSFVTTA